MAGKKTAFLVIQFTPMRLGSNFQSFPQTWKAYKQRGKEESFRGMCSSLAQLSVRVN